MSYQYFCMHVYKHLVQILPRPHNYKNHSRKYIDMHNDANDHTWGVGEWVTLCNLTISSVNGKVTDCP